MPHAPDASLPVDAGPRPAAATAADAHGRRATITGRAVVAWIASIVVVAGVARSLHFDPPRGIRLPWSDQPLPELCGSQRWFGADCPGCGLTRSFVLSAQGRWPEAWQIHPAGTATFGLLIGLLPYRLWQGWRIATGHRPRSTTTAEMLILAALTGSHLIWWVARTGHGLLLGITLGPLH